MRLFASLVASLGLKPHAVVDDERTVQTAARLLSRLEHGAWDEAEEQLANASDEGREQLLYACGQADKTLALARRWTEARPGSARARLLLGASLVVGGWLMRGGSDAGGVDAEALAPYLDALKEAEAPLHASAHLDKRSADAYAWLMAAEIGAGGAREKLQSLFRAAIARSPLHWPAHYRYFMATTEKWGGSHKDMFSFARTAARRAPRKHPIHCLVASAYCQYALALGSEARRTVQTPQCAREVADALYAWLDADASSLGDRLLGLGGASAAFGLNHFAVACYLTGARAEGREVIAALRGEIETLPWIWIADGARERNDPGFVHDRVKRELGRG
jgi:hypothetical protein